MMRPPTNAERDVVLTLAAALPIATAERIRADLADSMVTDQVGDGSILIFTIHGYDRPPRQGQRLFPMEGVMRDADGAEITVLLYAGEGDRLLELELIRWAEGNVVAPDWKSFRITA